VPKDLSLQGSRLPRAGAVRCAQGRLSAQGLTSRNRFRRSKVGAWGTKNGIRFHSAAAASPFPEAPVRQPRWLRFLAWMELLGGAIGILVYFGVSVTYPTLFPTWHNLLAVAFFGANIVAGILLVQERENGLVLSFIVQLLQVVSGIRESLGSRAPVCTSPPSSHRRASEFLPDPPANSSASRGHYVLQPGIRIGRHLKLGSSGSHSRRNVRVRRESRRTLLQRAALETTLDIRSRETAPRRANIPRAVGYPGGCRGDRADWPVHAL